MSKYIQSFYQYPVTFSSIGKGVPCKDADGDLRNIAEFTDEEIEKLERCEPLYRTLVAQKKYRILNKLPESYRPASALVNEAREEAEQAKAELAKLKAELEKGKSKETPKAEPKPETEKKTTEPAKKQASKK